MEKLDKRLSEILIDLKKQRFGIIIEGREIYIKTKKKKGDEIISLAPWCSVAIIHGDYERVMQNPRFSELMDYFVDEDYWINDLPRSLTKENILNEGLIKKSILKDTPPSNIELLTYSDL